MRRRPEATTLSRKLVAALQEAGAGLTGDLDLYVIERLYPGHWQRSAGAFGWGLRYLGEDSMAKQLAFGIGSRWTARECAAGGEFHGEEFIPTAALD